MSSHIGGACAAVALAGALGVAAVQAQQPRAARDFEGEIREALQSAKTAAGFEFLGTLARTCLLPQSGGEDTSDVLPGYLANPATAPARDTWYAEPAKVFDNLYFVGGKIHSAWALTTSDGIIVIDTIFPYNSEELIVGGMQKLGLDPKTIRYVLISHAHADHIGGAEMLQTRYGARVVMGAPDWDSVAKYPNRFKTMAPKRDIVATDGMKITLGGSNRDHLADARSYAGHAVVHVSGARSRAAGQRGLLGRHRVQLREQHAGSGHQELPDLHRVATAMAERAASTGATVILSNHSEFDNAVNKNRMIAGRGDRSPSVRARRRLVQRYFQTLQGCARAAQLALEKQQTGPAR